MRFGPPRDPWLSPLKSQLQKLIRRGMIDDAVVTARELEKRNVEALARRLTVIAAEDVDWRLMPDVCKQCAPALVPRGRVKTMMDPAEERMTMIEVAASMAGRPKEKDAFWMACSVWNGRLVAPDPTLDSLAAAIEAKDHRTAMAVVFGGAERGTRHLAPMLGQLRSMAEGVAAREIVDWSLWRAQIGGVGFGECLAAAVMAVIDKPQEQVFLAEVGWKEVPFRFHWFALDGHTRVGKIAQGSFAKKNGIESSKLGDLMFAYESCRMGTVELPSRWKREAMERMGSAERGAGWGAPEVGEQMWMSLRDDLRGLIEWLMDKEGMPR